MEPTIYKPSIYKGAGIYKLGAEGGGGGPNYGSVVIGGRSYKTVKIGNKEWLAENLDYKWPGLDIGGNTTFNVPHAYYYNNDEDLYNNVYKCGLLYNGYAVDYLEQNKSDLLPDGWRVSTETDYDDLYNNVSPGSSYAAFVIKAEDNLITNGFPSGFNGKNYVGFNLTPAGNFYSNNSFSGFNTHALIWTCTSSGSSLKRLTITSSNSISSYSDPKQIASSVRLVCDL